MSSPRGTRPKPVLFQNRDVTPEPGASEDDFMIYASSRGCAASGYYGTLKVLRKTDGRLLFPFDGAETFGPFSTKQSAIAAAQERGEQLVAADIARPEL